MEAELLICSAGKGKLVATLRRDVESIVPQARYVIAYGDSLSEVLINVEDMLRARLEDGTWAM